MSEPALDFATTQSALRAAGQEHVLAWWPELSERARRRLLRQLALVDLARLPEMQAAIAALGQGKPRVLSPAPVFELASREFPYLAADGARAVAPLGEQALRRGQVACLLVAGGQGTRLGFPAPKGCYPLLPLTRRTLFEVFARKLLRVSREYGCTPPLYVMVSNQNEAETREFWATHEYFGLPAEQVQFFAQGEMPALDAAGKLVMEDKDRLFLGPDGHGGVLQALRVKGMLADLRRRGVRVVSYIQVDNAQIPPADPAFLGLHLAEGAEVSLKVVRKDDPAEKVGIFCLDDGRPGIVEYTEFSAEQAALRAQDGGLLYRAGSIAVHAFSVDFLNRLADTGVDLPLHAAHKKVPYLSPDGIAVEPAGPNAWKFERFVFDAIPLAGKVAALEVPRDEQFLPLKNADGPFGPDGFRAAYHAYWGRAVELALGKMPPAIEVDPLVAENARDLMEIIARSPAARRWDLNAPLLVTPESLAGLI